MDWMKMGESEWMRWGVIFVEWWVVLVGMFMLNEWEIN